MKKVLLHPRVYRVDCDLCNDNFDNIFDYHVYDCINLKNQRHKLANILIFYNFPHEKFVNRTEFLSTYLFNEEVVDKVSNRLSGRYMVI